MSVLLWRIGMPVAIAFLAFFSGYYLAADRCKSSAKLADATSQVLAKQTDLSAQDYGASLAAEKLNQLERSDAEDRIKINDISELEACGGDAACGLSANDVERLCDIK